MRATRIFGLTSVLLALVWGLGSLHRWLEIKSRQAATQALVAHLHEADSFNGGLDEGGSCVPPASGKPLDTELVKSLLERGADPDARNWRGRRLVHLAAAMADTRLLRRVL